MDLPMVPHREVPPLPKTPCQERRMPKLAVEESWRRKWPRKLWQMWVLWGIIHFRITFEHA
jgi:hypothetical protein